MHEIEERLEELKDRGLYRKLRVVFVNGRPFVAHMAVSERWMVHYLNADMGKPANRAEEAEARPKAGRATATGAGREHH